VSGIGKEYAMRSASTASRRLAACAALAFGAFAGGAMAEGALPASTASLYPLSPSATSAVQGSQARAVAKGKIEVDLEALIDATSKVASRNGLEIDHRDTDNGKLSGKGYWQSTCDEKPCKLPVTFAAYFEPADCNGKEWDLTFVLDRHGLTAGDSEKALAQTFVSDVQKLIWTKR
jgi:hypothetical protein